MKKVVFWTLTVIVLVSVILGISSEQNVEVWGWICGVSYILLAFYSTKLMWNAWKMPCFARPVTALAFAVVLFDIAVSDIGRSYPLMNTTGIRLAGCGLSAVTLAVMGVMCLVYLFKPEDKQPKQTEKTEQPEQTEEEQNIDGPLKFACLFLGSIYCIFLSVFLLGVGQLIPMSLNTLGIMLTFVFIVPMPLVIAYFSGSIFGSSHAKTENHDPEPYDGFAEEHCPGFDEFEADDDDFVDDDDFEGREAEEE